MSNNNLLLQVGQKMPGCKARAVSDTCLQDIMRSEACFPPTLFYKHPPLNPLPSRKWKRATPIWSNKKACRTKNHHSLSPCGRGVKNAPQQTGVLQQPAMYPLFPRQQKEDSAKRHCPSLSTCGPWQCFHRPP